MKASLAALTRKVQLPDALNPWRLLALSRYLQAYGIPAAEKIINKHKFHFTDDFIPDHPPLGYLPILPLDVFLLLYWSLIRKMTWKKNQVKIMNKLE